MLSVRRQTRESDHGYPSIKAASHVDEIYPVVAHLEEFYPNFCQWFNDKVQGSLSTDQRALFVCHDRGYVVAIAIAKRTIEERKLCTLWVKPAARRRGIAGRLG